MWATWPSSPSARGSGVQPPLQVSSHLSFKPTAPIQATHPSSACPADPNRDDIVTEALDLFRANSLFRNFEIKGPADRLLIYLILFIGDCLTKITQGAAGERGAAAESGSCVQWPEGS